ncbi:MAG TPA: MgtC/SapB family protein [Aquabacterium sp.]|nr:MgtC/SapB family protein [Aquabacterium sp.]
MLVDQMGLAVALGVGLLIGLERERRKGEGPERRAAGLRSFMVAALLGAVAQTVSPWLAGVAVAGVVALASLSYWQSRSNDPGLTTELALVTTALIGALAVPQPHHIVLNLDQQPVPQPAVAAATGVVLASLLAARERLHRFATDWLSEQELHDALLLAALVLVLLPLLPTVPLSWMGSLSLHQVLMLMIVILGMQAAGHLAQRLMGDRAGLAASGLLGGFVSSTATISAMGSLVRSGQASMRLGLCAAILSTAATWLQMVLMASVVSPKALGLILPLVVLGALVPLSVGAVLWRDQTSASPVDGPRGQMLRPREAVIVALLLVGGAVLVHGAQAYGVSGVFMGTGLAAVADAHAPVASLLSLFEGGRLSADHLLIGLMVALSVNGATRTIAALVTGGPRFAMGVGGSLLVNVLVGWAWVLA